MTVLVLCFCIVISFVLDYFVTYLTAFFRKIGDLYKFVNLIDDLSLVVLSRFLNRFHHVEFSREKKKSSFCLFGTQIYHICIIIRLS